MSSDWPLPGYRYVAPLEQGRAIHHAETVLGTPVVVKVFTGQGDDRAAAYVGLSGEPGWPAILATGILPTGATFVIMPRFGMASLHHGMPELARSALRDITGAVDALHRRGRAHGDIRAGNVMVTEDGSFRPVLVGLTNGNGDRVGDIRSLAALAKTLLSDAGETPDVLASVAAARSAADLLVALGGAGRGDTPTTVVGDGFPNHVLADPDETMVVSELLFDSRPEKGTEEDLDSVRTAPEFDHTVVVAEGLFDDGETVVIDEDLFLDDDTVVVSDDLFDSAPARPIPSPIRSYEDITVDDGVDHGSRGESVLDGPPAATPEGWLRRETAPVSPFPGLPSGSHPVPQPQLPVAPARSFQAPPPPLGEGSASMDLVSHAAAGELATQFPAWFLALCALGLLVAVGALVLALTA